MKILTIIGARPQFIKAATVSREVARRRSLGDNIQEILLHTGQHFDKNMSDIFFEELKIPKPDINLGINSSSHGKMTGEMLSKIEEVLQEKKIDVVLVYGDTNSTLAGALAASKLGIPVAHVEAGLRSFNLAMPEEINRALTDRISTYLFTPSKTASNNLRKEGYPLILTKDKKQEIIECGDVMYDASEFYKPIYQDMALDNKLKVDSGRFIFCTLHRQENTDNYHRLKSIINALNVFSEEMKIVFPIHPRTNKIIKTHSDIKLSKNIEVIEPLGYLETQSLIIKSAGVLTDSGGLQKEAYFHKKKCVTVRDETEWTELSEIGVNSVVGAKTEKILEALKIHVDFSKVSKTVYGNGDSAEKIIDSLMAHLGE
ncbi:non-hydrolyzing UDP-N-acetylglucosamine 2-epimerase [Idiomarina piscisalsi]|uniref:UDP-N-acetylglucosamine 2-epimerase (Non-hydrolyzing) n=1 Tax=Idiomarina piscisalsi TaxID=1096243 RepID=A0A432YRQ1_9GAMM|nr:UDP-N-acetylglucosamine 2-epimerase (non-hydrolyzing) [Idiomarina piscisalsi]RUO64310.1 UDP-N-acetylglucosamine 2-epimerase (non-hydrolyzing) [Idiomarina piscisalsi]